MKRKVRTISVNNQKFVWWYNISESETTINISPFHDKTSIIRIKFSNMADVPIGTYYNENIVISDDTQQYISFHVTPPSVVISKDNMHDCVEIVAPKMVRLLISYFIARNDLFVTRKTIVLNGYDVLSQMGFQIVEVKKRLYL